jgi:two-component system, response regulator PdtaR
MGLPRARLRSDPSSVLVRLATREEIEAAGFHVHDANDADEPIQLLEAHPDMGLIFTDVDMPGSMDGVKLTHCVRKRWPPVKIIITSGFKSATPDQLPIGSIFLSKPYQPEQLRRKIDVLFESSADYLESNASKIEPARLPR